MEDVQTTHGRVHGSHRVQTVLRGSRIQEQLTSVMNNWGANHGAISYGHIGADLITTLLHAENSGLLCTT